MTFSKIQPTGWAENQKLLSSEMNDLDTDHANAIDGAGGGAYTLTGPLSIDGDDIALGAGTDVIEIGDTSAVTLAIEATTSFGTGVTIASGGATIAGNSTISGNLTLNGTGALSVTGNATIGNASGDAHSITGTTTVNGPVVYSGTGRPQYKTATLTDSNANITPVTANIYYMPNGVMSAGRTVTIDDTDCANGDWLWVTSAETGASGLTVNGPGGSPTYHTLSSGTGDQMALFLVRIAGTWRMIGLDYFN